MHTKSFALALALAGVALTAGPPALAQGYGPRDDCADRIHQNGTTGALLGGVAGALLGSNLASHHGGRAGGALLGGAAGAAIGNNIARSSTKNSCDSHRYGDRGAYGRYAGYPRARYGYAPESYQAGDYAQPGYGYGGYGAWDDSYGSARGQGGRGHHGDHHHHDHFDDDD